MTERATDGGTADLVDRWFGDLFTDGDLDVADEILAGDVDYHGPRSITPMDVTGPVDVKEYVETYRTAFPDLQYTVERTFEADGVVVAEWSVTGTQEEPLFDMDASGEAFAEDGVNVFTIEDGRITSVRSEWDTLKMVQELGLVSASEMTG